MKVSRLFSFTAMLLIIIFGLHLVQNLWIWLGLVALCGILPGRKWNWGRYFLTGITGILIFFIISPPDERVLDVMGQILPIGSTGYLAASVIVSALVFSLIANTVKVWTRPFLEKPERRY